MEMAGAGDGRRPPALPFGSPEEGAYEADLWTQMNKGFRFLLDRFATAEGRAPSVAVTMTCPSFEDSPIIGTLFGFEEVTGRSAAETIGKNCRFLNKGCENDPETLQFMRDIQSSPEAAAEFRQNYPEGKQFLLQNQRPSRTQSMRSTEDQEHMIFFYNFIHIFGVEVTSHGKNYQVLVGVQYVLMKANDFTAAQEQTRAVQKILEDDHDLGVVFRQWCVRALERFILQFYAGDSTPPSSLGEGQMSPIFSERKQIQPARSESLDSPPVRGADLVARIRTLMGTIEQVELLAKAEKSKDNRLADDRLAQVQFNDLVDIRREIYQLFHSDLEQYIAWYTVPNAWRDVSEEAS
jgi:hypothetical protein